MDQVNIFLFSSGPQLKAFMSIDAWPQKEKLIDLTSLNHPLSSDHVI